MKWKFAAASPGPVKYLICNGDEGDPGAFMDASIMDGDPHAVIEGMIIGSYAIGAHEGYIYVRAEYPLAVKRLKIAIAAAQERGFLGDDLFGSGWSFHLKIKEGAGAFVCGEETALIASIEGKRGMPRTRPPFPAVSGLWGKPTNINNVETWSNIPWIIANGAEKYRAQGARRAAAPRPSPWPAASSTAAWPRSPWDPPCATSSSTSAAASRKAGSSRPSSWAVRPAAAAGRPARHPGRLREPGRHRRHRRVSGGMVVADDATCMVDLAKYFLQFTQNESCGKCVPCRLGTKRMLEILERITCGEGEAGDIEKLQKLALAVKSTSLCGLGQTAPNPVLTTIRYFRDEYEAHIAEKRCPALACKSLIAYTIDSDKCTGCTLCAKRCPVAAVSGEKKTTH